MKTTEGREEGKRKLREKGMEVKRGRGIRREHRGKNEKRKERNRD